MVHRKGDIVKSVEEKELWVLLPYVERPIYKLKTVQKNEHHFIVS